jgi:hypothetical protein
VRSKRGIVAQPAAPASRADARARATPRAANERFMGASLVVSLSEVPAGENDKPDSIIFVFGGRGGWTELIHPRGKPVGV